MPIASEISIGMRLFCTAEASLVPGTILQKNPHGLNVLKQVVLGIDAQHQVITPAPALTGHALYELAFEVTRLREFAHLPSRLNCLFFWQNQEQAKNFFIAKWQSERSHQARAIIGAPPLPWSPGLYEVEVLECSRAYVANMDLISYFEPEDTLALMFERARRYWSSKPGDLIAAAEVLLEGTVRVVNVLEAA